MEEAALKDEYFVERKLYPNVDFYSGLIYRAIGIPTNMFTVMFALGRLPGWLAQWKELKETPGAEYTVRDRFIQVKPNDRTSLSIKDKLYNFQKLFKSCSGREQLFYLSVETKNFFPILRGLVVENHYLSFWFFAAVLSILKRRRRSTQK